MSKLKDILRNRWFQFSLATVIYVLWFVVWTEKPWLLLGVLVIFDIYITKYLYRLFGRRLKEWVRASKGRRQAWGWIESLLFAVIVVSFINTYFFRMYVIPTSSMEKSLLVGDYLFVSKVTYGPVMPNTPLSFPLVHNTMPFSQTKKSYSTAIQWPYHRLKGFRNVERYDAVVFNYPDGDTMLLENPALSYHELMREFTRMYGPAKARERVWSTYTVVSHPVDKRENYVKRCIGLPGDSIEIRHSEVWINGQPQRDIPGMQWVYFVTVNGTPISQQAFEEMGIAREDINYNPADYTYSLPLTKKNLERIQGMRNVTGITKYEAQGGTSYIFPHSDLEPYTHWNEDNFGPLWIPAKGSTVELTLENLPLYERIIDVFEGHDLAVDGDRILIDGAQADSYTFAMDYYWMMGDNRHNSLDARYWGFVPEDHIVGKASVVLLSLDKDKKFPKNIRWGRLFHGVK